MLKDRTEWDRAGVRAVTWSLVHPDNQTEYGWEEEGNSVVENSTLVQHSLNKLTLSQPEKPSASKLYEKHQQAVKIWFIHSTSYIFIPLNWGKSWKSASVIPLFQCNRGYIGTFHTVKLIYLTVSHCIINKKLHPSAAGSRQFQIKCFWAWRFRMNDGQVRLTNASPVRQKEAYIFGLIGNRSEWTWNGLELKGNRGLVFLFKKSYWSGSEVFKLARRESWGKNCVRVERHKCIKKQKKKSQ